MGPGGRLFRCPGPWLIFESTGVRVKRERGRLRPFGPQAPRGDRCLEGRGVLRPGIEPPGFRHALRKIDQLPGQSGPIITGLCIDHPYPSTHLRLLVGDGR